MRRYPTVMTALALLVVVGCGGRSPTPRTTAVYPDSRTLIPAGSTILPADEPDGWEHAVYDYPVKYYVRENLYLYLDQKAHLYKDYGFVLLQHGTYRPNLLGDPTVVVDAYEMNLALHAYGIFTRERNRNDPIVDVGVPAHLGDTECVFWKGRHFVRVKLITKVENPREVLQSFAVKTAGNIEGRTSLLELRLFPAENRVPAGDTYYVDDVLGYDFMPRGFTMEYDLDGKKATMFLAIVSPDVVTKKRTRRGRREPTMPGNATTTYVKLHRKLLKVGELPEVLPGPWEHGCRATEPKLGRGLIARKGRFLTGIFGAPNEQLAVEMTSRVVDQLE